MKEPQIPSFLYRAIPNVDDRVKAIENLRLLQLWQLAYPKKPFNMQNAVELQRKLNVQYQANIRKQAQKTAVETEKAEKESVKLHREIAELVLGVEVLGEHDDVNIGEVAWNGQIRDKYTRKNVGTPRSLLNGLPLGFGWRTHTSATVDLQKYLSELKEKYDNFTYPFSFERTRGFLSSEIERTHATLTFSLRLFWRSLGVGTHARKKIHTLLRKYKR